MRARRKSSRSRKMKRGTSSNQKFPVVAIGASAGGLEAVSQLLSQLPANAGIAIVLIQHLSAKRESSLVPLLSRVTRMPVSEATHNDMRVEGNCVYVIPPGKDLTYVRGALMLKVRQENHGLHMPIDRFMESLVQEEPHRAIGVVLSGTGSDGALGVQAIKAKGGITLAQNEDSAKYGGMPHAAIATGCIDFVLPPSRIAAKLVQIARHPYLVHAGTRRPEDALDYHDFPAGRPGSLCDPAQAPISRSTRRIRLCAASTAAWCFIRAGSFATTRDFSRIIPKKSAPCTRIFSFMSRVFSVTRTPSKF